MRFPVTPLKLNLSIKIKSFHLKGLRLFIAGTRLFRVGSVFVGVF